MLLLCEKMKEKREVSIFNIWGIAKLKRPSNEDESTAKYVINDEIGLYDSEGECEAFAGKPKTADKAQPKQKRQKVESPPKKQIVVEAPTPLPVAQKQIRSLGDPELFQPEVLSRLVGLE
jgi:hypothetical protein